MLPQTPPPFMWGDVSLTNLYIIKSVYTRQPNPQVVPAPIPNSQIPRSFQNPVTLPTSYTQQPYPRSFQNPMTPSTSYTRQPNPIGGDRLKQSNCCLFPWWWNCGVFQLLLGPCGLSPHLNKTVHTAWGLAANFWNFTAKTWGLAANACTNAMLDHSCLQLDINLSYLSYSTPQA